MNHSLDTIVQSLSKEEVRFFKLFLKRTDSKNRKDVDLFDLIRRKNGDYTTKDALKKLKTNPKCVLVLAWNFFNEIKKNNQDLSKNFVSISELKN